MSKETAREKMPVIDIDRIVQMAWEDRTPFDAIKSQFGLVEKEVIELMRHQLQNKSFIRWRKRVNGRSTKHVRKRNVDPLRFKSARQREITHNKISKR